MMKRKLTQALMLALSFAGIGMLGSCKDYDEDKVYELTVNGDKANADLKDYVDQQDATLKGLIETLQTAQNNCKQNCESKFTELNNLITQLQNKDAELKNLIDTKADQTVVDALQKEVDTLKGQISTAISDISTLQTNVTTLQGDINTINEVLKDLEPRVAKNEADIANLVNDVTTINNTITTIQSDITNIQNQLPQIEANKTAIEALQDAVDKLNNETIPALDTRITQAQKDATDALTLAQQNKTYIENVETNLNNYKTATDGHLTTIDGRLDDLESAVADLQDQIDELNETSAKNFQTAIAIAKQADAELKAEMLQEIADAIADYDTNLQQQLTQMAENIKNDYEAADAALKSDLVQQIADAKQEVLDILNPKIADLETKYNDLVAKDADLQQQIDDLKTQVDQNTADIAANTQKIDDLTGRVTNLENAINKMITGISVQGTYNPVYGTFALPTNTQSNVLMAFIGKTDQDLTFPTQQTGNYPFTDQALTADEAAVIGGVMDSYSKKSGKVLLSDADDNAGTLYVNVNPNTVDFTGATLKLENSQAGFAGVTLKPLTKSDETLSFGYTRAADNAFYEAKAHIDVNDLDALQQLDVDKTRFKEIAQNIINTKSVDLTDLADAVYTEINAPLNRLSAVASWTDAYGDHSVYSDYNVAATAVQPLSFAFAKDYANRSTLPGYERIESFIDRIANRVNKELTTRIGDFTDELIAKWPTAPSLKHIDLDKVTLADSDNDGVYDIVGKFLVTYTIVDDVEVNGYTYDIVQKNGKLYYSGSGPLNGQEFTSDTVTLLAPNGDEFNIAVTVDVDLQGEISDVIDEILAKINNLEDNVEEVNQLVDALNDYLSDVDDVLDLVNNVDSKITSASDKIVEVMKEYLSKINDKGIKVVNAIIARMQPCMLVSTEADGMKMGINAKNNPVVVNSTSVTLVPTSYTAEILTPAFKKHVACVDCYDKNGNQALAEAKSVNGQTNMNTVIDGAEKFIKITLKSGYTYKFAYSALDYNGKICVKRVWVRVK